MIAKRRESCELGGSCGTNGRKGATNSFDGRLGESQRGARVSGSRIVVPPASLRTSAVGRWPDEPAADEPGPHQFDQTPPTRADLP